MPEIRGISRVFRPWIAGCVRTIGSPFSRSAGSLARASAPIARCVGAFPGYQRRASGRPTSPRGSLEAGHVPSLLAATDQCNLAEQDKVRGDAGLCVGLAGADADGAGGQQLARFALALDHASLDQKV